MGIADQCWEPVTFIAKIAVDTGETYVYTGPQVAYMASVQGRLARPIDSGNSPGGMRTHVVYTASDTGASRNDHFLWRGQVLVAVGPSRDMGGRGEAFAVDCQLID